MTKKTKPSSNSKESSKKIENKTLSKDEVIVSVEEIEETVKQEELKEETKESKKKKKETDEEPSWYHYVIVLLVFFAVFGILYFGFNYFYDSPTTANNSTQNYIYKYQFGNVTYNIELNAPIEEVQAYNYTINLKKEILWNSVTLTMAFDEYNGTDNGDVTVSSSKLTSFLKWVYHFKFETSSFTYINQSNCSTSTNRDKVILFEINSEEPGVFLDKNGCIQIKGRTGDEIIKVVDSLIYTLIEDKKNG